MEVSLFQSGNQRVLDGNGRPVVVRSSNDRGAAVTESYDMLDGLLDTPLIVYRNGAQQLLGRAHVAEHHANSRFDEFRSHAPVDRRGHHRDSADVTFDQLPQDGFSSGLVVLGVAKKDVEPAIPSGGLESVNHFGEIRVGNLRNHQPEQIAATRGQPPGVDILEVFHLPDDF